MHHPLQTEEILAVTSQAVTATNQGNDRQRLSKFEYTADNPDNRRRNNTVKSQG